MCVRACVYCVWRVCVWRGRGKAGVPTPFSRFRNSSLKGWGWVKASVWSVPFLPTNIPAWTCKTPVTEWGKATEPSRGKRRGAALASQSQKGCSPGNSKLPGCELIRLSHKSTGKSILPGGGSHSLKEQRQVWNSRKLGRPQILPRSTRGLSLRVSQPHLSVSSAERAGARSSPSGVLGLGYTCYTWHGPV